MHVLGKIEAHLRMNQLAEQVGRFGRVFAFALAPQLMAIQGHIGRSAVLAAIAAAAEVAFRQVFPAVTWANLKTAVGTVVAQVPPVPPAETEPPAVQ